MQDSRSALCFANVVFGIGNETSVIALIGVRTASWNLTRFSEKKRKQILLEACQIQEVVRLPRTDLVAAS